MSSASSDVPSQFGPFVFDSRAVRLTRDGQPVTLQRKVIEALALFVAAPGQLVSRDQLRESLWPDVVVTDSSMAQVIRKLRRALGDDRRCPRYLQTVPGLGYRFIAPVTTTAPTSFDDPGFVGREAPLAALSPLIARHRWVTLLGPGGIGKTRLARHVAGRIAHGPDAPAGGVHFCSLAEARDANCIHRLVRDTLPVAPQECRHPTLLVLDNVEHVAELTAQIVCELLRCAPISVITTSRIRLKHPDERCLELGPLPAKDAVAMLRDRVDAVRAGLSSSLTDAMATELVEAVDGLPLAIVLLAPRLLTLTPEQALHRLQTSLHWLKALDRHHDTRHQSLDAAVSWSFADLSDATRTLFTRCASFDRPFQVSEVEARGSGDSEVVAELLLDLRDRSLLAPVASDGPLRFRLYRHVREYALRAA
ncbi:MAG: winged helix-turn-helix domain-containing protein [Myxococcales bacterium]|nr:winged helix-turn-helix domain-containing protein [Myxococcales bacterium]